MYQYSNITFRIDYKMDVIYRNNDSTSIYYNCGNGSELGMTISFSNNNIELDKPYINTSFSLPSLCNYQSNIHIIISQNPSDNMFTRYFNFENACLSGIKQSLVPTIVSTKAPSIYPTISPTQTPTLNPSELPTDKPKPLHQII